MSESGSFIPEAVALAALFLLAAWVAKDANRRGMNGLGWAFGTFFLPFVLLIYSLFPETAFRE